MHRFNGWRLFIGGALKPCHNHWVMHPRSLGAIWKSQFSKDVPGTVYRFYGNYLSSIKNLLPRIAGRGAPVVYPPTLHRFVLGPFSGAVRIASMPAFIHSFSQSVSQPFIRSSIYRTAYPRIPSFLPLQIQCGVNSSSFLSTHHSGPFSHPHLFKGL